MLQITSDGTVHLLLSLCVMWLLDTRLMRRVQRTRSQMRCSVPTAQVPATRYSASRLQHASHRTVQPGLSRAQQQQQRQAAVSTASTTSLNDWPTEYCIQAGAWIHYKEVPPLLSEHFGVTSGNLCHRSQSNFSHCFVFVKFHSNRCRFSLVVAICLGDHFFADTA